MTISEIFHGLRIAARETCTCGNKDFTAPEFHRDDCPYQEYATRRLEEHKEGREL